MQEQTLQNSLLLYPVLMITIFFSHLQRFFLALRLIALAQNGKDVSLSNLTLLVPAPKVVS